MTTENIFTTNHLFHSDLKLAKALLYDKCGFDLSNPKPDTESAAYGACSFVLNGKIIQHRVAKITPAKTGQFVTIWKRNKEGITEPFDINDDLDFIIITTRSAGNFGQFIFPKLLLADKGIITRNGRSGKRGIRVYPPWDIATNKQAVQTQHWQSKYFLTIGAENSTDLSWIKELFSQANEID